jgi:prepilin peptidase CpaA
MENLDLQVARAAFALYVLLLAAAAVTDLWKFKIPNWVSVALLLLFVPAAIWLPLGAHWLSHVGAALSVLAAGILLFLRGWLGAGDVKLMAAVALWTGFAYLAQFVVFVALAGGALALVLLVLRLVLARLPAVRAAPEGGALPRVLVKGERVPYGVAIACGAILLAVELPYLSLQLGA